MPSSIAPGTFVLHSSAIPDLPAGAYVLHAQQSFSAPDATTPSLDSHIEVTAPRFILPPDQILSTFPPNKSEGAFSARLPQIVLKRRTLPWERELDGKLAAGALPREIPWLALVLLADGECEFLNSQPVAKCVTPGVVLEGRNDSPVGDAVVVTRSVVEKVFPTKEDLPLLAHVREVDFSDTELAMGDDDGWLAVVLCNRLPQDGVRYRACLISLEGQYALLRDTAEVEPEPKQAFASPFVYPEAIALAAEPLARPSGPSFSISDAWSADASHRFVGKAAPPVAQKAPRRFGKLHELGSLGDIKIPEPRYTFPVLANWQFTCAGGEDFQKLMHNLDVGMLDTVMPTPVVRRGQKPPPPRARPEPQVVDTGHVALSHRSRAGETETVWYRGPLTPHPGGRDAPDAKGRLPLLHASDQARRIGPDGRENLSLAAAFEIGRLLALAEPSVVAAFLNWRKEALEGARRQDLAASDAELGRIDVKSMMAGFAARLGARLVVDFGRDDARRLGRLRPLIDEGRPIEGLDGVDLVQLFATGFGVEASLVRSLIAPGAVRDSGVVVPVAAVNADFTAMAANAGAELGYLRDAARDTVGRLAADALRGGGVQSDAVDRILARGSR